MALALARGEQPKLRRGAGRYRMASSHPLRVFEPVRVARAPAPEDVSAAAALFPETICWNECRSGDTLSDFAAGEDGASFRYGVVNLGADAIEERDARLSAVCERLGYEFEPLQPDAASGRRARA